METTREVLEEWRPLMCPFDVTMIEGCNALGEFLPIVLKPEEVEQGYKYTCMCRVTVYGAELNLGGQLF